MADPQLPAQPTQAQAPQSVSFDNPPQTVSFDTAGQTPSSSGQPAPQSAQQQLMDQEDQAAIGFAKGIGSTISGVGGLLRKGVDAASALDPGRAISYLADKSGIKPGAYTDEEKNRQQIADKVKETLVPSEGKSALDTMSTPHGLPEMIGYGGETLAEFMLGDEAVKGFSLADQFKQISQVAGIFEKSPRLMRALQMGADITKAAGMLGPEEQAAIKKSPILAHLVGAGMDAVRQGAVQGAQTLTKTGGDVGQAAKEGGVTAGISAVLGGAGGTVARALEKAGTAAEAGKGLNEVAKNAPTEPEVTNAAKSAVDSVEKSMHDKFETGIQDLKQRLSGASVPNENSPIATGAKQLMKPAAPAAHELVTAAKEASGERLDQPVKDLLNKAASSKQPWTVDDLVDFRQSVRKLADSYDMGDPNARALRQLMPSVDDTIGKLAEQSGDTTAKSDYQALRNDYKNTVKYFQPQPSSKPADQLAYNTTKVLRSGTKDDIGKYLLSGGNIRAKIGAVNDLLGPDKTKDLGKDIFSTMVKDSSTNAGAVNPANLLKQWNKIPDQAKTTLFDTASNDQAIEQLMTDAKSAAQIQHIIRGTLAGGVGAAAGGLSHTGLGTLLGLTVGEAGGGFGAGRKMLDYVATHPAVWKTLGVVSKAGEAAKPFTQAVGPAVKQQAAQTVMGKSPLANILSGASEPLTTGDQGEQ